MSGSFATPWTIACQAPLSMGFPRQEYWTGCMLSRFNRVRLSVTLWTMACQAPLSTGFYRQEHLSGLPCPSPAGVVSHFLLQKELQTRKYFCPITWPGACLVPHGVRLQPPTVRSVVQSLVGELTSHKPCRAANK